ncbi:MAG: hypothetical protein H7Z43_12180 [Clostridia bacterium]|nr:hypothetical protein [Deltaproteobacteria bacterium]
MKNVLTVVFGASVAIAGLLIALATLRSDKVPADVETRTINDASVPSDEAYARLTDEEVDAKISWLIDQQSIKAKRTL